MQMETNAVTGAMLATQQPLSTEVEQIQMSSGLCLALCSFFSIRYVKVHMESPPFDMRSSRLLVTGICSDTPPTEE